MPVKEASSDSCPPAFPSLYGYSREGTTPPRSARTNGETVLSSTYVDLVACRFASNPVLPSLSPTILQEHAGIAFRDVGLQPLRFYREHPCFSLGLCKARCSSPPVSMSEEGGAPCGLRNADENELERERNVVVYARTQGENGGQKHETC